MLFDQEQILNILAGIVYPPEVGSEILDECPEGMTPCSPPEGAKYLRLVMRDWSPDGLSYGYTSPIPAHPDNPSLVVRQIWNWLLETSVSRMANWMTVVGMPYRNANPPLRADGKVGSSIFFSNPPIPAMGEIALDDIAAEPEPTTA